MSSTNPLKPHNQGEPMKLYYVIRDVPMSGPNPTSYKRGRTIIGRSYHYRHEAEMVAEKWNRHRGVDTFQYVVHEQDDLSTDRSYFDFYSQV